MSDFKKLQVWQKAHALSLTIDRICKRIRGSQYASLRSQLFRAAMSIPANIAEEVEYHLIVARDTKVISESDFVSAISQTITVRKMLYGLLNRLSVPEDDGKVKGSKVRKSPQPKAGPPTAPSR